VDRRPIASPRTYWRRHVRGPLGHRSFMSDQERSANQPMNGPRRPLLPAVLGVLGLVVVIALLFALITWVA
jgi:hypothetical protein